MLRTKQTNSPPGVSARPVPTILGLAMCCAVSLLLSPTYAQPVIRTPEAPPTVRPPAQRSAEITSVIVTYFDNSSRPRLSDMGSSSQRRGNWMRILIQFSTQPQWIDEIRFDCFVLMRDRNNRTLLTGSVACIYVKAGRQHLACIFVPPNVLERYGRAEAVGVECYYQNSAVSDYTVPRVSRKWWQDYTGVPGTMVSWFYTPFSREGIDRYEQVKVERQGF